MRGAETPVDVQVLGQERRGDEPCPVVHEPLGAELPHARVDERIAGAAVLPGLERLAVVAPAVAARTQVLGRDLGARGEQLVVEVAPAELAHERLAAFSTGCALGDLERRKAPEAQVRREP